jgi:hypothetical protein
MLYLSGQVFGQYKNPFDIKHRLDSVYNAPGININTTVQDTVISDPLNIDNDLVPTIDVSPIHTGSENPFDVDHVPIRRSELQTKSVIKKDLDPVPERDGQQKVPVPAKGNGLLVFGVALFSLLLLSIVASVKRSIFSKIFKSFTNDNMLKLTQREEHNGINAGFLILYIVFALNAATLIYLLIQHFSGTAQNIWLVLFLGVAIVYLIRHISMYMLGFIFPVGRESSQYSFLISVVNILLGILFIPLNLIIAYAPDSMSVAFTFIAIGIIAFAYIIRAMKGFLLGLINYGAYGFHFFLYLCTFEIAPCLMIYRVFSNIGSVS